VISVDSIEDPRRETLLLRALSAILPAVAIVASLVSSIAAVAERSAVAIVPSVISAESMA